MHTIIFDFGNVLGYFDHARTLQRLKAHTDMSVEEMRRSVYGSPLEDAYETGHIATDMFLTEVARRWRLRCDHEQLAAAWSDIFQVNEDVCRLVPALKRRCRLLLGSNTNDLHSRRFREQFADTLDYFDGLVMSHQVGVRKPHRGFFEQCRRLAGCEPGECLFIDDLADNVAGARACGWHGIVYVDATDLRQRLLKLGLLE
jgi:putative hydrolase of the HAD superfamily